MSIFSFFRDMMAINGAKHLYNDITKPRNHNSYNHFTDENDGLHDYESYDYNGGEDYDGDDCDY